MSNMSTALGILKHCVLAGVLVLTVSACTAFQSAGTGSNIGQIGPDRVQAVSDALQARLQLIIPQPGTNRGG